MRVKYEGFTHEEAVYGVDKCGADWNEQAALKAQDYLDYSSFSREGLIEQLEYEGHANKPNMGCKLLAIKLLETPNEH